MNVGSRRHLRACLAIILICLYLTQVGAPLASANPALTIRVAPSGSDEAQCGSEASPCRTIQYAVDQSSPGDTILVAEGTYTLDPSNSNCEAIVGADAVVCSRDPQFTLLGGFSTSDWSSPDPETHVTVIDGQDTHRGVFLLCMGGTTDVRMEGFTIRNGLARGIPSRPGDDQFFAYGGGMFVDLGYPPVPTYKVVLRNLIFKDNKAIGDDHAPYGGSGVGGGLAFRSVVNATLEYLTFEGNEARGGNSSQRGGHGIGGGVHTLHSDVTFSHITLINNVARAGSAPNGSGWYGITQADGLGGGAATHGINLRLEHVFAQGNQAIGGNARDQGGAAVGGAILVENATLSVVEAEVLDNRSIGGTGKNGGFARGGGIGAHDGGLTLQRARVIANVTTGGMSPTGVGRSGQPGGGGVYVYRPSSDTIIQIENSVIADNALEFGEVGKHDDVGGGGGGIWLQGAEAYIRHTTIARNRLSDTGLIANAILAAGFDSRTPTTLEMDYSILADHVDCSGYGALYVMSGGNVADLERTLWTGNCQDTNEGGWDYGMIYDLNPLHTSSAGFVSPGAPDYDYHIRGDSAARDEAMGSSMAIDIDGDERILSGDPDIGADEQLLPFLRLRGPWLDDGTLRVSWESDQMVARAVDHYDLIVSCEQGASPPAEGGCDSPINVGLQTSYTLTGLTNGKAYTMTVQARDNSDSLITTSNTVSGIPRDFDFSVHLPFIIRIP
jgi:hypothetical protein